MKPYLSISFYLILSLYFFLYPIQAIHSQLNFAGTWEGTFMNNFKTVINFSTIHEKKADGNLQMFDGTRLIQDDQLTNINLVSNTLKFYIPAKETSFEGRFNDGMTELTGDFIFPDRTKHAIQLKRKIIKTTSIADFKREKEKKIDVKDLHTDLQTLYETLKDTHPQLYTFASKDDVALLLEKIQNELNAPLTLEDFYLQIAKLTDAIKCSHTGVKLPSTYQKLVHSFATYFPLRLYFENGKAFYISGLSEQEHQVAPGTEVMGINDSTIDTIIKQLFYYLPSEGCNTTTKYNELNKRFNTLFYLVDDSAHFNVTFKTGNSVKRITVSSSRFTDLQVDDRSHTTKTLVDFKYINTKTIGVLKVSSFAIPQMDAYLKQLDSIFRDLKANAVQNLIVDLRDNAGGHPIFAAQLLSYLTDKEFIYFKRNEAINDFEPLYQNMQPNTLNFSGNVYVFVNGGCLSTAGHLISLLKFNTKALFIGEEPGSTFRCNDFSMQMALPKSGILVNIPRTTFETSVSGLTLCEPFPLDFQVTTTVSDLIGSKDPYVAIVLSISKT